MKNSEDSFEGSKSRKRSRLSDNEDQGKGGGPSIPGNDSNSSGNPESVDNTFSKTLIILSGFADIIAQTMEN